MATARRHRTRSYRVLTTAAAAAAGSLLFAAGARAQSSNWATATTGNWSDPARWAGSVVANGIDSTATFNVDLTANTTVHLDTARTIGNLVFGDTAVATAGNWILDNNASGANVLTLALTTGAPTITVNALNTASSVNISAELAGTAGLTKAGAGSLVLSGANTYTGATTVNAGTLSLTGTLNPAGNLTVAAGQRFVVNGGSATFTGTSQVSGTTGQILLNSGSLSFATVQTNNTRDALIRVNGGTFSANSVLVQRSSDATVSTTVGFIVAGGTANIGTAVIGSNNSWGHMSVEGGTLSASGIVTLGQQQTAGRGGVLRVTAGEFNATELNLIRQNGTFTIAQAASATFSGGISSVGTLSLGFDANANGSAGIVLNGGQLYIGSGGITNNGTVSTAINLGSGTLGASADWSSSRNASFTGNVTIKAANVSDSPRNITLSGNLSGTGGFVKTGGGSLTLLGINSYLGATTVSAGSLVGSVASIPGSVANSGNVTFDQASLGTYNGVISGTGSFTKSGAGTLRITNAQTYTGATTISGGVLHIGGTHATSGATVTNGAGLSVATGGATINALTLGSTAGDNMSLAVNDGSGIATLNVTTTNGLSTAGTTTISIGSAGLTLGTHTLIDYAGAIGGSGFAGFALGTLPPRVTANLANNVGNTSVDLNVTLVDFPIWIGNVNGNWDINTTSNWKEATSGNTTTYLQNSIPGDQVLFTDAATGVTDVNVTTTVQPSFVTVNNSTSKTYTFSGTGKISGSTGLLKQGNGSLTISNSGGNDFVGTTTIDAGTVILGASNVLSDASPVTLNSATLNMNGNTDTTGIFTLAGGTISGGGSLSAPSFDLRKGSVGTALAGTGDVTKTTVDSVTLSTAATYTGPTNVQNGTLVLGTTDALPITTNLIMGGPATSGTVDLNGFSQFVDRINSSGTGTANSITNTSGTQSILSVGGNSSSNYTGALDGNIALLFNGTNHLSLGGTNSFTGGTTLTNGGTLTISSDASLGAVPASPATNLTLSFFGGVLRAGGNGIVLNANRSILLDNATVSSFDSNGGGNTLTITGLVEGGGSFTKIGNGTVVLSNANTYGGGTNISAGSIRVTNNNALSSGTVTVSGGSLELINGIVLGNPFVSTGTTDNMINVPVDNAIATFAGSVSSTGGNQFRPGTTGTNSTLVLTGSASVGNVTIIQRGNVVLASTGIISSTGAVTVGRVSSSASNVSLTLKDTASVTAPSLSIGAGSSGNNNTNLNALALTVQDSATLNMTGNLDVLNVSGSATGSTVNFNGGTTTLGGFVKTTGTIPAVINFNGGVVKAAADNAAFMPASSGLTAQIQNGGAILNSNGFAVQLNQPLVLAGGSTGALVKQGAGTVTLASSFSGNDVTVQAGTLAVAARSVTGGNKPLYATNLSIDPSAVVDMKDNDFVVNNGSYADISAKVFAGFGAPNPGTITSSTTDGSQIHALFDNALVGATDWLGQPISASAVVAKYTYFGDANIDGQVTGDDYGVVDANLDTTPAVGLGWLSGDMNLDGSVTGDDYGVIDANLGLGSGNPLSPSALSSLSAVPEPASLTAAGLALGALMARRRRQVK